VPGGQLSDSEALPAGIAADRLIQFHPRPQTWPPTSVVAYSITPERPGWGQEALSHHPGRVAGGANYLRHLIFKATRVGPTTSVTVGPNNADIANVQLSDEVDGEWGYHGVTSYRGYIQPDDGGQPRPAAFPGSPGVSAPGDPPRVGRDRGRGRRRGCRWPVLPVPSPVAESRSGHNDQGGVLSGTSVYCNVYPSAEKVNPLAVNSLAHDTPADS